MKKQRVLIIKMTVINMISFGEEGVAVADEQSSSSIRKYNVAQKLRILGNAFIYGGSGPADCVKEVYDLILKNVREAEKTRGKLPLSEVFRLSEGFLIQYKNQLKDKLLNSNLGIGLDELITGVLNRAGGRPLDENAKNAGRTIASKVDEEASMQLLLGGVEEERFEIYRIDTRYAGMKVSRPYDSIGSGSDESDKVLSGYVEGLSRTKRESIDKVEGLIKIIEATNSSSTLNVGVGGSPSISYVSNKGIIQPNESQCILVSELVKGLTKGLLDRDFVYQSAAKLVYENDDFETVDEEMKQNAKDWKKLDRLLRGYKN